MNKFVFYVVDLDEGSVRGTNNVETAEQFIDNDKYVILHQNGTYFQGSREENEVTEIEDADEEGESDED